MERELRDALRGFNDDELEEIGKLFAASAFATDVMIVVTNSSGKWKVAKLPAWYGHLFKAQSRRAGEEIDLLALVEKGGWKESSGRAALDRVASLISDAEEWKENPKAVEAGEGSFVEFLKKHREK